MVWPSDVRPPASCPGRKNRGRVQAEPRVITRRSCRTRASAGGRAGPPVGGAPSGAAEADASREPADHLPPINRRGELMIGGRRCGRIRDRGSPARAAPLVRARLQPRGCLSARGSARLAAAPGAARPRAERRAARRQADAGRTSRRAAHAGARSGTSRSSARRCAHRQHVHRLRHVLQRPGVDQSAAGRTADVERRTQSRAGPASLPVPD